MNQHYIENLSPTLGEKQQTSNMRELYQFDNIDMYKNVQPT